MSRRPLLFCRGAILLAACRAAPAFNSPCRRSQTLRRDAALVSRPKEQATRPRVLLWVSIASLSRRPLLAANRTSVQVRHRCPARVPPGPSPLTVQAPPENPLAADVKFWVDTVDMVDTQPRQVDRGVRSEKAAGAGASGRTHVCPHLRETLVRSDPTRCPLCAIRRHSGILWREPDCSVAIINTLAIEGSGERGGRRNPHDCTSCQQRPTTLE